MSPRKTKSGKSEPRPILEVLRARPTLEGAGVHLKRVFGFSEVPRFDPFLLLDDFHGDDPAAYRAGFPWHPHRGIETITIMLRGSVQHGDSLGNRGTIGPGDVQWMTAGGGIIHEEMPHGESDGTMGGFQLWANLPAAHKMTAPRYREVQSRQIPEVELPGGARLRVIAGQVAGERGPVADVIVDPLLLDVRLPAGGEFDLPTPRGHTAFAYLFQGRGVFCCQRDPYAYEARGAGWADWQREPALRPGTAVRFGDGDRVLASAEDEPLRFLLAAGRPLGEPVAWYGPIVMNTREELRRAFEEYERGAFLKHAPPG